MSNVTNLVLLLCAAFAACIGLAAMLHSCDNQHKTNFVMDRGDYRYVMIEEEQFNRLIKALEDIAAQKGNNGTQNR